MTSKILVVNGPNLNLLGTREPAMYGAGTLADLEQRLRDEARQLGIEVAFVQSNHEGELIDHIQAARADCTGIVINPAGFTHTSVAIRDALLATELPIAEVHITNVHRREKFRQHSYISDIAEVVIAGAGFEGYALALQRLGLNKENS